MISLVEALHADFSCPKCHHVWPADPYFWHRTILPMGNGVTFIAALCKACTDSGPNRKQVTEHNTVLEANRAGKIVAAYYNFSLSG